MLRRQPYPGNTAVKFVHAACLIATLAWTASVVAQDSNDEKKAWRVATTATNAQNDENFDTAITNWNLLLDKYPDSKEARKADFNLGKCYYATKDYGSSILAFEKALPLLQEDQSLELPELLLLLGYCRLQEGRQQAAIDAEESNMQLTTATLNLKTILVNYKDYEGANSAAYYQGQAYEALGQLENAKASFEKSLEFDNKALEIEAMFALGGLAARQNEYEDAGRWYDRIRTSVDSSVGHRLLNDTNLNYGESLLNVGIELLQKGETESANNKFREAKVLLTEASSDETFDLRDDAIFLNASCSMYLGNDAKAAEIFESVANIEGSELNGKATVLAGSSYLKSGNEEKGVEILKSAIDSKSSFAVDAVHELAVWQIGNGRFQEAYDLTDQWVPELKGHPLAVNVMLDRANASRELPDKQGASAALYAEIYKQHPTHPMAPKSMYWSAFSNYLANRFDDAISQADAFQEDYAGDDFLPDMLEIRGDSLLMKGNYSDAEATFRNLATDFQNDKKKKSWWITRSGFASYLQENYDETIEWLENQEASIVVPRHQSEALYWTGLSHYKKQQFAEAEKKLQEALVVDGNWSRTPEIMRDLCNTQLKLSQFDDAEKTAQKLLNSYPENRDDNVGVAIFAVGSEALNIQQYDRAIRNFDLLASRLQNSALLPNAIYEAARAALENNDNEGAAKRFDDFVNRFPDHPNVNQATLGKTNALRMSGNTDASIEALIALVDEAKAGEKQSAQFQLGLAYSDAKDWDNAIATFQSLADSVGADDSIGEKAWYELAWAQRENGAAEDSLSSFATLVENYPDSPSAPEAHFLLGQKSYSDKKYDEAIEQYSNANTANARDEIREKAQYKLGWCHFRKGEFDKAGEWFQRQADEFSKGKLYADGRYMVAQSAYRAKQFEKAFQAYTVAKPAIEDSVTVSPRIKQLTLLNGARSGNKTKNYKEAADMASALTAMTDIDEATKQQANLELGIAEKSQGNFEMAKVPLESASENDFETGAHAMSLLGDILFKEAVDLAKSGDAAGSKTKFDEAVNTYSTVYYSYGGSLASADVKSWQAYAAYEAARCYMVQIKDASNVDKVMLIGKAIDRYQYLVTRFPNSKFTVESEKQLKKLTRLKEQIGQ